MSLYPYIFGDVMCLREGVREGVRVLGPKVTERPKVSADIMGR